VKDQGHRLTLSDLELFPRRKPFNQVVGFLGDSFRGRQSWVGLLYRHCSKGAQHRSGVRSSVCLSYRAYTQTDSPVGSTDAASVRLGLAVQGPVHFSTVTTLCLCSCV